MKNRLLTAAAVLMCTATFAGAQGQQSTPPQHPQGGERGHGMRGGRPGMEMGQRLLAGIDLTADQKAKIKAIDEKYRPQNQEARKKAVDAMQKARQSNDTAAIRAAMSEMRGVYSAEQEKEILAVLTPEQQTRYNKNKEEMKTKMKEGMKEGWKGRRMEGNKAPGAGR